MRANVVAYLALFFALGGIAGAAAQPLLDKPGSVKGRHIDVGAVHASDLATSVREQVQVTLPVDGNYQGQNKDGSITIGALVNGGQIVDMSVAGDCAWDIEGGNFDANGDSWTYVSGGGDQQYFSASGEFDVQNALIVEQLNVGDPNLGALQECPGPVTITEQHQ